MCKGLYAQYKELMKECNEDYDKAYIKATNKVTYYISMPKIPQEQREDFGIWNDIRNTLALVLAGAYIREKGYKEIYTKEGFCYFEEERMRNMNKDTNNTDAETVGELIDCYELEGETVVIHNGKLLNKEELCAQEQM